MNVREEAYRRGVEYAVAERTGQLDKLAGQPEDSRLADLGAQAVPFGVGPTALGAVRGSKQDDAFGGAARGYAGNALGSVPGAIGGAFAVPAAGALAGLGQAGWDNYQRSQKGPIGRFFTPKADYGEAAEEGADRLLNNPLALGMGIAGGSALGGAAGTRAATSKYFGPAGKEAAENDWHNSRWADVAAQMAPGWGGAGVGAMRGGASGEVGEGALRGAAGQLAGSVGGFAAGGAAGAGLGYLAGKGMESSGILDRDLAKVLTPEMMAAVGGTIGGGLGSVGGGYAGSRAATQKYIPEDSKFASVLDQEKLAISLAELMILSGGGGIAGSLGAASQLRGDEGAVAAGLNAGVGVGAGTVGGLVGGTAGLIAGEALDRKFPGAGNLFEGLGVLGGAGLGGYGAGALSGKAINVVRDS